LHPDQCELIPLESTKKSKRSNKSSTKTRAGSAPPPTSITLPLPTASSNISSAINPFFSNIRQNLELSHGPLQERFPVRLPYGLQNKNGIISSTASSPNTAAASFFNVNSQSNVYHSRYGLVGSSVDTQGNFDLPLWLKDIMDEKTGPRKLAELYEVSIFYIAKQIPALLN
jgi:protein-tyrosine phosphatase